jgi:GxxExxY protein
MDKSSHLFFPQLSYTITGICFEVHNTVGRYSREKQYADLLEQKLKSLRIPYKREVRIDTKGNIADFIIDNSILLELKAKQIVTKDDYYQVQRYLQCSQINLGIIVNFHRRYLAPKRIVRIDTERKQRYT